METDYLIYSSLESGKHCRSGAVEFYQQNDAFIVISKFISVDG